jgi:polyhydroxybutyrate depolymerase
MNDRIHRPSTRSLAPVAWLALAGAAALLAAAACGTPASTSASTTGGLGPDATTGASSSGGGSSGGGSSSGSAGSGEDAIGGSDDASGSFGDDAEVELDGGASSNPGDAAASASADAASGSDASSCTGGAGSTAGQAGYVGDWTAGDYPADFVDAGTYLTISGVSGQQGNTRQYAVHVPAGYRSAAPVPAVFCLHGLGQTASLFCLDQGVAWPTKGDEEGFVVIMPNGYMNSWNGGTCCGGAASAGLDDVALIRAIFAEVGTHVNIDLGRVYATGLSNGGYLSYRLGCEASDLFVAVAPSAGAVGTAAIGGGTQSTSDLTTCAPTNKISVLDIHGTSDPLIPYADQAPSMAAFQAANGCSTSKGPSTVPPSGGDTTCVTFAGCPTCPDVAITGCSIDGGGHCWFGSSDCGTGAGALGSAIVGNNSNFMQNTSAVWSFFSQLSR